MKRNTEQERTRDTKKKPIEKRGSRVPNNTDVRVMAPARADFTSHLNTFFTETLHDCARLNYLTLPIQYGIVET